MLRVSRLSLVVAFAMSMAVYSTATNSAVSASRSSFSASRPSTVSRPSANNSLSNIKSASNFKSTSVRSIGKITSKPVYNKVPPKKPLYSPRKKTYSSKTEYEYYAFNDCVPYSKAQLNGWRCIDRD